MNTISPIVRLPTDVASAGVNPAPTPSGDTADAILSLPMRLDSVSVTSAASAVLRGAAVFSSELAAAPASLPSGTFAAVEYRFAQSSWREKLRFNSQLGASRDRQAVVIPGPGASSDMTAADRECSGIVATHDLHHVGLHGVVVLPLAAPNFANDCVSAHCDADNSDNCNHNHIDNHFQHSIVSMIGVNTV